MGYDFLRLVVMGTNIMPSYVGYKGLVSVLLAIQNQTDLSFLLLIPKVLCA